MGVGETISLLGVVTFMLVGLGLLTEAYKRRLAYKERALELKAGTSQPSVVAAELARLEKRVRVLERVATDQSALAGTDVALQIEALREEREVEASLVSEGRA